MFRQRHWRSAGWHWVLALVLLLMQQVGLLHRLHHVTHDEGAPHHTACLECVAHHASDAGAASAPDLSLTPARLGHVLSTAHAPAIVLAEVRAAYHARAPPVSFKQGA